MCSDQRFRKVPNVIISVDLMEDFPKDCKTVQSGILLVIY